MTLKTCLLVFAAGGCGSLGRYLVCELATHLFGRSLPLGTLIVNVLGCFFFGLIWELASVRLLLSETVRVALCAGFLGGFTTFSSLVFDSWALAQTRPLLLVGNVALQTALGLAALLAGMHAARLV